MRSAISRLPVIILLALALWAAVSMVDGRWSPFGSLLACVLAVVCLVIIHDMRQVASLAQAATTGLLLALVSTVGLIVGNATGTGATRALVVGIGIVLSSMLLHGTRTWPAPLGTTK